MDGYLMEYGEKRYATNADNLMEAEDKLFALLGIINPEMRCKTSRVESLEALVDKNEIIFF
jgi:hypothetical protein